MHLTYRSNSDKRNMHHTSIRWCDVIHKVLYYAHVRLVFVLFFRCVDMVKSSQYVELANDLEINKAITYLRQKDFNQVTV